MFSRHSSHKYFLQWGVDFQRKNYCYIVFCIQTYLRLFFAIFAAISAIFARHEQSECSLRGGGMDFQRKTYCFIVFVCLLTYSLRFLAILVAIYDIFAKFGQSQMFPKPPPPLVRVQIFREKRTVLLFFCLSTYSQCFQTISVAIYTIFSACGRWWGGGQFSLLVYKIYCKILTLKKGL